MQSVGKSYQFYLYNVTPGNPPSRHGLVQALSAPHWTFPTWSSYLSPLLPIHLTAALALDMSLFCSKTCQSYWWLQDQAPPPLIWQPGPWAWPCRPSHSYTPAPHLIPCLTTLTSSTSRPSRRLPPSWNLPALDSVALHSPGFPSASSPVPSQSTSEAPDLLATVSKVPPSALSSLPSPFLSDLQVPTILWWSLFSSPSSTAAKPCQLGHLPGCSLPTSNSTRPQMN